MRRVFFLTCELENDENNTFRRDIAACAHKQYAMHELTSIAIRYVMLQQAVRMCALDTLGEEGATRSQIAGYLFDDAASGLYWHLDQVGLILDSFDSLSDFYERCVQEELNLILPSHVMKILQAAIDLVEATRVMDCLAILRCDPLSVVLSDIGEDEVRHADFVKRLSGETPPDTRRITGSMSHLAMQRVALVRNALVEASGEHAALEEAMRSTTDRGFSTMYLEARRIRENVINADRGGDPFTFATT